MPSILLRRRCRHNSAEHECPHARLHIGAVPRACVTRAIRSVHWEALTLGRPAALQEPPDADAVASELARLQGCEAGALLPSTLHLFWDLFASLRPRRRRDSARCGRVSHRALGHRSCRVDGHAGAVVPTPRRDIARATDRTRGEQAPQTDCRRRRLLSALQSGRTDRGVCAVGAARRRVPRDRRYAGSGHPWRDAGLGQALRAGGRRIAALAQHVRSAHRDLQLAREGLRRAGRRSRRWSRRDRSIPARERNARALQSAFGRGRYARPLAHCERITGRATSCDSSCCISSRVCARDSSMRG